MSREGTWGSKIRIALTGVHGSGKDQLIRHIQSVVAEAIPDAVSDIIGSSARHVRDVSGEPINPGSDWLQLWSATQRRLWALEMAQHVDIVLSPRTGLDEVAYQGVHLAAQRNDVDRRLTAARAGIIIPGNQDLPSGIEGEGDTLVLRKEDAEAVALMERSELVFNLLIWQAVEEIKAFWDVVYLKRRKLDVPIEDDGIRSPDEEFAQNIQDQLDQFLFRSPATSVIAQKIVILPDDLDEAKVFLEREAPMWREYSDSGGEEFARIADGDGRPLEHEADPE